MPTETRVSASSPAIELQHIRRPRTADGGHMISDHGREGTSLRGLWPPSLFDLCKAGALRPGPRKSRPALIPRLRTGQVRPEAETPSTRDLTRPTRRETLLRAGGDADGVSVFGSRAGAQDYKDEEKSLNYGAPGEIRTPDLMVRSDALCTGPMVRMDSAPGHYLSFRQATARLPGARQCRSD